MQKNFDLTLSGKSRRAGGLARQGLRLRRARMGRQEKSGEAALQPAGRGEENRV